MKEAPRRLSHTPMVSLGTPNVLEDQYANHAAGTTGGRQNIVRGPPRKPRQSGKCDPN
jgi:hypothetical protein